MSNASKSSYEIAVFANSAAIASLVPVALYQCGVIEHLPDPPGALYASDQITRSKEAHPLGIPDSLLGLASYGFTLRLLSRAMRSPRAKSLLRAKLLVDSGIVVFNVVRQLRSFRKLCSWCMGTAIATAVLVPAARAATGSSHRP
jgi:Vitamin K epoxide reductase family